MWAPVKLCPLAHSLWVLGGEILCTVIVPATLLGTSQDSAHRAAQRKGEKNQSCFLKLQVEDINMKLQPRRGKGKAAPSGCKAANFSSETGRINERRHGTEYLELRNKDVKERGFLKIFRSAE